MFCVPKKEEEVEENEAPIEVIRKMKTVIKSLVNTILGIRIFPLITPSSITKRCPTF